jgi:uncharacterized membrane protein YfcA
VFDNTLENLILILSSFGTGIAVGTASGTAGVFMIPCLSIFIGFSIHEAIGTSLFLDCIIGATAGIIFFKHGNVKIWPVMIIAVVGAIFAYIGSFFTSGTSELFLTVLIGGFLVFFGVNLLVNGVRKNIDFIEKKINFNFLRKNRILFLFFIAMPIGLVSGFAGMGSSGIVAVLLIFLLGYNLHMAIGTSLFTMSFIAGSGALAHYLNNEIILSVVFIAGTSVFLGAVVGSKIANRIDENRLGRLIGLVILVLGFVVLVKLFL